MSLYAALAGALIWAGSLAGAFFYGIEVGDDRATAAVAREDRIAAVATAAAVSGAASAIAANKPRNVTIRQEIEREIQTNVVYRDCKHSPEQLQRINSALTGDDPLPAGSGIVPKAGPLVGR
jgi:hypothetical protein